MNGTQESRTAYPQIQPPAPAPPTGDVDPGLGYIPPAWRKNVYGYGNDPRRKSPALAGLLSLMPGLGQVYVGYYQQGFINIIIVATIIWLLALPGNAIRHFDPFLGLFLAFYWLYNVVDAFRRAAFYNQALAGMDSVDIPDEMKLPKGGGSLVAGVALIAVGLLAFANTALGMSLDWLEQWWPMGLVLLGAYLVYANWASKKSAAGSAGRARETGQPS